MNSTEVPDYECETKKLAHDEKMDKLQEIQSTTDTVTSVVELISSVVSFVAEHPEIVEATVKAGKKAKQGIVNVKNKLVAVVKDGKEKTKESVKKITSKSKKVSTGNSHTRPDITAVGEEKELENT